MAGAEGFEPPKAVLETAGLPLAYAPTRTASTISLLDFSLLLNFPVCPMAAAKGAKLLQLQPLRLGLLILGLAIVLAFALGALQSNNFSHRFALLAEEARIQKSESRMIALMARSLILNSEFCLLNSLSRFLIPRSPLPFPRPPSGRLRGLQTAIPYPWPPA
jgi:hypothetical protein